MSEYRIKRRRIKTNIRQAKTKYKFYQILLLFKIMSKGQISRKSIKHWYKVILGLPKYTVDKSINIHERSHKTS